MGCEGQRRGGWERCMQDYLYIYLYVSKKLGRIIAI
jgi:hypothetical protein